MKKRYKLLSITLSLLLLFGTILSIPVSAASYTSDWQHWSQGASDDPQMRSYGCWVVAQARLIRMLSIDTSLSFNPDTYLAWERNNGHINSRFNQVNGVNAPVNYAKSKGKTLNYLGDKKTQNSIWTNINSGYYSIVCVYNSSKNYDHFMLVDNETTKSKGSIYLFDSYSDSISVRNTSLSYYLNQGRTLTNVYTYSYESHTHSHSKGYEADHPHRVYMKCSCGDTYYTGETTKVSSCEKCYPLKVTATDESKPTGFSWYNFENAKSYDLRINKMPSGENILTEFGIKNNEYSYNLPAGDYRAELCAGNVNGTIDWFPTVDFTVGTSNIDIADTYPETPQIEIEVAGNEIFATWNKCDNADKYNAYLTYYITEEDLINNGFDPESFYASMIWEAEDQELNVGASIGDYMFSYFVAQTNATYRIKVEAVNSTTEAKTVAYSEAITIKKYKAGDVDGDNNVTDQDAIYLLFNCYFPDEYPLTQTADFNKDSAVNDQDAIYLLFYVYFPKEYPI